MAKYRVSVVISNAVREDGETFVGIHDMAPEEALDYVCEMAVDPDVKAIARDGWALDEVFLGDPASYEPPLPFEPEHPFCFDAEISREAEAGTPSEAAAEVLAQLEAYLAEDGPLYGWEMTNPPEVREA